MKCKTCAKDVLPSPRTGIWNFINKSTKKYDADVGREQHGYPSQAQLPV